MCSSRPVSWDGSSGLITSPAQFYVDKSRMRFMMVEDKASPRLLKSLCAWFHCLPSLPEGYTDGFGFAVSTESEDAGGYLEVDGTQIKQ